MKVYLTLLLTAISCSCSGDQEKAISRTGPPSYHFSNQEDAPLIFTKDYLKDDLLVYSAFFYGNITIDDQSDKPKNFHKIDKSLTELEFNQEAEKINVFRGSGSPYFQILWDESRKKITKARIFCYDIHDESVINNLRAINYSEQRVYEHVDRKIDNVEVLDLFNCQVYDYSLIRKQFINLSTLALPYKGCDFESGRVVLPAGIETLIVYNSAVGQGFFKEVSSLKNLKRLVLYGCNVIDHDREKFRGAPIPYSQQARDQYLSKLVGKLERLEIYDCDSYVELFFCIGNRWDNLTDLTIRSRHGFFGFTPVMKMWDFKRDERVVSVADEYPRLQNLNLHSSAPLSPQAYSAPPKSLTNYLRTSSNGLEVNLVAHGSFKDANTNNESEQDAPSNR